MVGSELSVPCILYVICHTRMRITDELNAPFNCCCFHPAGNARGLVLVDVKIPGGGWGEFILFFVPRSGT